MVMLFLNSLDDLLINNIIDFFNVYKLFYLYIKKKECGYMFDNVVNYF